MSHLRKRILRLAHAKPELRQYLIPLLKEAAQGHRLLRNVDHQNFEALEIGAAYDTQWGERWHHVVRGMNPLALEDKSQWTDAVMTRFADKVGKSKGDYITKVRVYGRVQDPKTGKPLMGLGGLVTLIEWSREDGFSTDRESERELKRLDQEREKAERLVKERAEQERLRQEQAEKERAEQERQRELQRQVEDDQVWSVAQTGYDLGEDDDGPHQGYVAEVDTFDTKEEAIAYARSLGGATVVKGTQMWNEPLGQVEEHNRMAWTRYYR